MALLHRAQLTPSKIELLRDWIAKQSWFAGDASALEVLGAYRFDDPDGEVGIETHLVGTDGGSVLQVPLTYRNGALAGAEAHFVGTMQHSVLGERWVHDGCADPVYATMLTRTILTGGRQADQERDVDGRREQVDPTARIRGSGMAEEAGPTTFEKCEVVGTTTLISATPYDLIVRHVLDADDPAESGPILTGTWGVRETPALLAFVHQG